MIGGERGPAVALAMRVIVGLTKVSRASRLIPVTGPAVDRLLADAPYYARAVIPGGFYRGTSGDTPTFGVRATLVTSTATPDEREMVQAALTAPLHPGAERYYREAGLL